MKFRIFASLMILSLIFTSGCLDLEFIYHTKINKDGSILRNAQATGDSSDIYDNPFPFQLDTSWETTYSQTMRDTDSVYMIEVHRTFTNVEELNGIYEFLIDSSQTSPISVKLEQSFQWFYTYYSWGEKMPQQFPFYKLSIDSFLTQDEVDFWLYSDSSFLKKHPTKTEDELEKEVSDKVDEYASQAIFAEFMELLVPFAEEQAWEEELLSKKEQLYDKLNKPLIAMSFDSLCRLTDEFIGQSVFAKANEKGIFKTFEYKVDHMLDDMFTTEYFTYFLECPGNIVGGNAVIDSNMVASWKFQGGDYFFHDYRMELEYRMPNYWAFVVTAFVLLFLLWFIVRTGKRG